MIAGRFGHKGQLRTKTVIDSATYLLTISSPDIRTCMSSPLHAHTGHAWGDVLLQVPAKVRPLFFVMG